MGESFDAKALPVATFAQLQQIAPDFSRELSTANRQGLSYASDARGPIESGQVKLDEFTPDYLKSHKKDIKPKQEIVRFTPQGELHIHFDADGLPAGADLLQMGGMREHVTTNAQGTIV